jgi:hypothetical protein
MAAGCRAAWEQDAIVAGKRIARRVSELPCHLAGRQILNYLI